MNAERWKRNPLPTLRTGSSVSGQSEFSPRELPDNADSRKPRRLSKALRSLSSSSLDSITGTPSRNPSSRRLQKTPSNSSTSMIERLHRRVSKDSGAHTPPYECPDSPMDQPFSAMEIIHYGHLKTDVSLLKARSEYLVLADQCLVKLTSAEAARGIFPQLSQIETHANKTGPAPSLSSKSAAAEIRLEIPLRSIVAVFSEEGSSPRFGVEIWWFSQWPRLAYCKAHFFFALPRERDDWLAVIQRSCRARFRKAPTGSIIPANLKTRINHIVAATESTSVEEGSQNLTFPVARRIVGAAQKANSTEETHSSTDISSFYLVIGPYMCYFVEVLKADHTTLAGDLRVKVMSFGTVTLTRLRASVASHEQRFVLCFRSPFGRETRLDLASTHYRRIIEALMKADRILKPMWPQHFQQAIFDIKGLPPPLQLTSGNDLGGLTMSLPAYCAAFHVQIPVWKIEWHDRSQPAFRLLAPDVGAYSPLQLLAVFRALRYNSYFKAISLRDVDLTSLIGKKDYSLYGDCVVHTSLNGLVIPEDHYDILVQAPVLVQEMHALMFASESIKRIDLTNVWGLRSPNKPHSRVSVDYTGVRQMSSEVIRPLLMLLKRQLCHCRSISMSGNPLAPNDVDELANTLVLDHVLFKDLKLDNCSLGDAGLTKLWSGLAGQGVTLETLDTSDNHGTVSSEIIRDTLSRFQALKRLNIAGNTRLGADFSLFDEKAINTWPLHELDVSGIVLNDATVDTLAAYLATAKSENLQLLRLNKCGLTARQIARLFRGMGQARRMTVHVNANRLDEGIDDLCGAISCGYGPWSLFIQMVEFTHEINYVKLLRALTVNKTVECLSLAGSATPDAASSTACQALSDFFSKNDTVRFLDISGYDAKLDEGRLGREFSRSLSGIRTNTRLEHLRIRSQMLNINIGDLAEAISGNKTLHTLDCESNDFNLSNFRHLVKHLEDNTTIRHFSAFSEQELARSVRKSVDVAGSVTPTRRPSVISRFRHDRSQSVGDRPLVQQLKDEWDSASASLEIILQRNQRAYQDALDLESEVASHSSIEKKDGESIFSSAFGGLARREYESRRAKGSHGYNSPLVGSMVGTPGATGACDEQPSRVLRSYSTVSSEVAVSPTTDGASSGSGIPTPPELDSPTEKEFKLSLSQSPDTLFEEFRDYSFAYADGADADPGLQMKTHRRFQSDPSSRIDEEDDGAAAGEQERK